MKKLLALLLAGIMVFAFAGCTEKDNGGTSGGDNGGKSVGIDLKLDFSHMNKTIYNAHINITEDDKVTEFDEEEPNFARIENEKDNYVLDISLDTEAKEAYEQFKTSAKENEIFEEVKFGKYEGYYSDDDGIYGYILLDNSDPTFNAFAMFNVYLLDESSENNDIQEIYNSSKIQNILNNVEFKTSK